MLNVYIDSLWYHSMICMFLFVGWLRVGQEGKSSKRFTVRALVSVGTAIGFLAVGTAIGFGVFLCEIFRVFFVFCVIWLSLLSPSAFYLPVVSLVLPVYGFCVS